MGKMGARLDGRGESARGFAQCVPAADGPGGYAIGGIHRASSDSERLNPRAYPDIYAGLIYPSFQERATKISHNNAAKVAAKQGDAALSKICQKIAGDESRHESFYTRMVGQVMQQDPDRCLMTFFTM